MVHRERPDAYGTVLSSLSPGDSVARGRPRSDSKGSGRFCFPQYIYFFIFCDIVFIKEVHFQQKAVGGVMLVVAKPTGRIKIQPADFDVREVVDGRVVQPVFETHITGSTGGFTAFTMTKRGVPGESAYREVARQLGVLREAVTGYGLKDAQAVTSQIIVVEGEFEPSFDHDRIWLRQLGSAKSRLRRGDHDGNRFTILVETDVRQMPKITKFLNLFGPQRFGDGRIDIGRHLLEGHFDLAVNLLQGSMNWPSIERIMATYGLSAEDALFHPDFHFDLAFKVNQWVSWLWNQLASESSESSLRTWGLESAEEYIKWWDPADLDAEMYDLIHDFWRPVTVEARNIQTVRRSSGIEHSFTLRSGSYATVYLQSIYELTDCSRTQ